jgi:hypothetical protein
MSLLLAGVLFLVGLGTLFVAPWVGGGLLAVAVVLGAIGLVSGLKNADEVVEYEPARESPHLPGPGNPHSGVD